jgi:dUTP pyrophosphatase
MTTEKMKQKTTNNSPNLKFYKLNEQAKLPTFATEQSACFDLYANLVMDDSVQYFSSASTKQLPRKIGFNNGAPYIRLQCLERMLIPVGLIADIPKGYSIRLHPRSGLSFKKGIHLANCEGVIDSDYVEPIFVMVTSMSDVPTNIFDGERICQGELVKSVEYKIDTLTEPPSQKTDRDGGFGSTGT